MDIYTEEDAEIDRGASKFINESVTDELTGVSNKNSKNDSPTVSYIEDLCQATKQKPSKKIRRPPNAFMLFAKERRYNLDFSAIKEKKCHINSVLGNMWRELPDSEKAKYLDEARRLLNSHKKSESSSLTKNLKKERRVRFKEPIISMGKSCKMKKKLIHKAATCFHKVDDSKNSVLESNSREPDEIKTQNTKSIHSSSDSHLDEHPNSSSQTQHNIAKSHAPYAVPSTESHHSKCCCGQSELPLDCKNNYKRFTSDLGMPTSCFASGFYPSMFPFYSSNAPFWMYQQAMAHQAIPPLPPPPFPPHLPYSYSSPYFYNSAYNSGAYFNAYSSLYSGRVWGPSSAESFASGSATATSTSITKPESAEVKKAPEEPLDELSVVIEKDSPHGGRNQEKTG